MEDLVLVVIVNTFNFSVTKALSKQNYSQSAAATQSQFSAYRAQMLISQMMAETSLDRHP